MQLIAVRQAFDRRDVGALGLQRQKGAALDRGAIDVNDTGETSRLAIEDMITFLKQALAKS